MPEVLIVGAGPVGTLLAAELTRFGVEVEMLERRPGAGGGSRAIGLHAPTLAALEAGGDLDVFTIAPGDCFFDDALAGLTVDEQSETSSVAAVPCAEEHTFEAYHEFTLPEGEYPGAEVVEEKAYAECETAFAEFIGVPYEESVYEYSFYSPSSDTWQYQDDRLVSCVASTAEYDRLTGSLEGAGE